jgi:hypothetical protein
MDDKWPQPAGWTNRKLEFGARIKQRFPFSPKPPDRLYGPYTGSYSIGNKYLSRE